MKLPEFKLERFFAEHEFSAAYLLCASDCQSMSVAELLEFEPPARQRLEQLPLGYTESAGNPALRHEIAKIYREISSDQVLVCSGAEEAIFLYMHAVLNRGDHAVVHAPGYQSLFDVARSIGADVERWDADESGNWSLDLDRLKSMLRPTTRLVIINTPHNPTGYLMSRGDWKDLHDLVYARNIRLFCDEVYRESEFDVEDRLPAGCDAGPMATSLGVMSKTYGLAGLRIGWIATRDDEALRRMASLKDYTTICNSAPSELLAEVGLRHRQRLVDRNVGIIKRNLEQLDLFFGKHPQRFSFVRPHAGAIGFPRLLSGDAESFCRDLVQDTGVLLAPGTMFGENSEHFRIGFGRTDFYEGLQILDEYLAALD